MAITEADAADLIGRMVAIPSVNPAFRQPGDPDDWFDEARMAAFVADWLRGIGLVVEVEEVEPRRPNVVGRLAGTGGARMLWEGHLDTVQVTGMAAPFVPRVEAGRLFGRGAVDDKGCLAAFMLALRELAAAPPAASVTFLAASDEEFRFAGIRHHIARDSAYDLGIAGEPTNLRVVRACKGCMRWFVEVRGKAAHTAKPHEGISAVRLAGRLLDAFDTRMAACAETHPLLGPPTLVCTGFEAGEGPNTVPSRAMLRFDYRYLPSQDGDAVWSEFKALAEDVLDGACTVHEPFIDSSAMDVPEASLIVTLAREVCRRHGVAPEAIGVPYGSDATKMVNLGGVPTIVFGPGSIDQAHARDEYVDLAEVVRAAAMLVDMARLA